MQLRITLCLAAALAVILLPLAACSNRNREAHAMTARDSLKTMHLSDDFHVELFASEPEVMSPVEMAFDETERSTWRR